MSSVDGHDLGGRNLDPRELVARVGKDGGTDRAYISMRESTGIGKGGADWQQGAKGE